MDTSSEHTKDASPKLFSFEYSNLQMCLSSNVQINTIKLPHFAMVKTMQTLVDEFLMFSFISSTKGLENNFGFWDVRFSSHFSLYFISTIFFTIRWSSNSTNEKYTPIANLDPVKLNLVEHFGPTFFIQQRYDSHYVVAVESAI